MEEERKLQGLENTSDEIQMAVQGKQNLLNQGLVNIAISNKQNLTKISLETPEGKERVCNDIVCVLDISGSMNSEAHVKNSEGVKERHGLTYLDLLKHATKTIIHNLGENDRFSLVSYSDYARIEYGLNEMSEQNIQEALQATENLQTEGCTNIWAGVQQGLEILRDNQVQGRHQSIILLTDGEPNVEPREGYIGALEKYKQSHSDFYFSLNSFAFGKNINTNLLDQYALLGNGQYSFIPCPGFIGTVFVNSISNILNTMGSNCQLQFELLNNVQLQTVPGGIPVQQLGQNTFTMNLGDLKFGQFRDIILDLTFPDGFNKETTPYLNVQVKYNDYINKVNKIGELNNFSAQNWEDPLVDAHYSRCYFVDQIRKARQIMFQNNNNTQQALQIIDEMSNLFKTTISQLEDQEYDLDEDKDEFLLTRIQIAKEFIENLKKDVDGESRLAVAQPHSFSHWGQHFLPSLNHAHLKQQCNNFCDPGIQKYGGQFFQTIKNQVEQTFLKLPAPKPSRKNNPLYANLSQPRNNNSYQSQQQQCNSPQNNNNNVNMNDYYNAGGGCIYGECKVQILDGSYKKIKELRKGDILKNKAKIGLVVKINSAQKNIPLTYIEGGLMITPKHPIKIKEKWVKPYEKGQKVQNLMCHEVYNFVLENEHVINVDGTDCVTLGHGIKEIYHEYFGNMNKVIQDLEKMDGFEKGFVQFDMSQFKRAFDKQKNKFSISGIIA